jgi:hypothetical protein
MSELWQKQLCPLKRLIERVDREWYSRIQLALLQCEFDPTLY